MVILSFILRKVLPSISEMKTYSVDFQLTGDKSSNLLWQPTGEDGDTSLEDHDIMKTEKELDITLVKGTFLLTGDDLFVMPMHT
jgi:hypothetical protein